MLGYCRLPTYRRSEGGRDPAGAGRRCRGSCPRLRERIADLCAELLPAGQYRGREFRVGSLAGEPGDAVCVELAGPKRGIYCDHRTGEGGDALTLVASVRFNGDLKAALEWARRWLGSQRADLTAKRSEYGLPRPASMALPTDGRRCEGLGLYLAARPNIPGNTAGRYIIATRGIPIDRLARPLRSLRFHPGIWNGESRRYWPAMVAAIVDPTGQRCLTACSVPARYQSGTS